MPLLASGLFKGAAQMSERHKTHNGRDVDGRFRVRQADVEDLLTEPNGADFVRDDVRLVARWLIPGRTRRIAPKRSAS